MFMRVLAYCPNPRALFGDLNFRSGKSAFTQNVSARFLRGGLSG